MLYPISIAFVYMVVGPALILLNKYILSQLNFPFPIFLSGLGVLTSGLVAQLLVRLQFVTLQRKEQVEGWLWYKRVLPVGFAHAATLAFGNLVYLHLGVGLIQMLKSFTPVMILLVGAVSRIEQQPSQTTVLSVLVIALGTATTCSFTTDLNLAGLFVMFLAEFAEAARLLGQQFFLQNLKMGVIETQFVIAPASAFWLFVASAVFEMGDMQRDGAFGIMWSNPLPFIGACGLGLAINYLSFLVIQVTSSLTMKILGTARNVLTILLGIAFFQEDIPTFKESLGYATALAGFALYNASKSGWNRICGETIQKPMDQETDLETPGSASMLALSDSDRSPMKKRQNSVDVAAR